MGKQNLATDLMLGAFAGGVATAVMNQVTSALDAREGRVTRRQENWARGGNNTNTIAAKKTARLFGADLSEDQAEIAGEMAHYAIGTGAGAAYGAIRRHLPAPAVVRGLWFGAALWLIADEIGNPAFGVTPGPRAFPWQAHARGLAAHLVYGMVTEGVLSVADRFLRHRRAESAVAELVTEQPVGIGQGY